MATNHPFFLGVVCFLVLMIITSVAARRAPATSNLWLAVYGIYSVLAVGLIFMSSGYWFPFAIFLVVSLANIVDILRKKEQMKV